MLLIAVFVVIGSSTVALVAGLATFAPSASERFLERMRAWLMVNNDLVLAGIFMCFGLALTARGLQTL